MKTYLVAVMLVACGDTPHEQPDAAATPDAVPLRSVTGVWTERHVTPTGEAVVGVDLTDVKIAAWVPPMFTKYPGSGDTSGHFSIPGVPVGPIYLQVDTNYIVTSADTIDLTIDTQGRTDVIPATAATKVTLNVTNLAAWQATDDLELVSPDTGMIGFGMQYDLTNAPAAAATSLAGAVYDLSRAFYGSAIGAADHVTITQRSTVITGAYTYQMLSRTFVAPSFTIENGGTATVAGSFQSTGQTNTLAVTWDRPSFDAELRAHGPTQDAMTYPLLDLQTLPEAGTRGLYHGAPDLVSYAPGYITDATAITTAWPYGDPFPSAWSRVMTAQDYAYRYLPLDASTQLPVYSSITVDRELATPGPIVPAVGTVVNPLVGDHDAYGTVTGVGLTPTIAWSAPTLGTANRYYVGVLEVVNGDTQYVASVETAGTSVTIPPGILHTGSRYVFTIAARALPSVDLAVTPYRTGLPDCTARVTTSLVTP